METVYIYGLFDPRTLELRYIGRAKNIKTRLQGHILEAKQDKKNIYKSNWIKQLLNEGLKPSIEILEECTDDTWEQAEQAWIAECRKLGVRLVNVDKGGSKPPSFNELPEDTRERVRKQWSKTRTGRPSANRGRVWSQEYKDKMSESLSGSNNPMFGKFGEDHPATGRVVSDATKQKLSNALRGKANPMFGKTHTEKAREKLSIAGKGRKQSEDEKTKKSLTNKMCRAYKKGLLEKVFDLQQQYFNLYGIFYPRYPQP